MKNLSVSLSLIFGIVTFLPSNVTAQTPMKQLVCTKTVPSMLEFVSALEAIPPGFDKVYEQMSAQDKLTFKNVVSKGHELALVAEAYRNLFIVACYGD